MALKNYKPTSPARRGLILVDKTQLWKGKPVKALTEGTRKTGGRNNKGHVTSAGTASGPQQKYPFIHFNRPTGELPVTVRRTDFQPHPTASITLHQHHAVPNAKIT